MKKVHRGVVFCAAALLALAACSAAEDPESIAQSFVERYYVHPDLPRAKALAHGLARRKIEEEERLLEAVTRPGGAANRGVSYSLHSTRKMWEGKIFFVYDITISVDSREMKKRAFIATGRVKEGWRVTNFQESDI
ncbi:MAG: hypothetical protein V3U42_01775 [candidate division NC10 bacterium]|nr:hypothetical protein [candidate division NC10 bacterium]